MNCEKHGSTNWIFCPVCDLGIIDDSYIPTTPRIGSVAEMVHDAGMYTQSAEVLRLAWHRDQLLQERDKLREALKGLADASLDTLKAHSLDCCTVTKERASAAQRIIP